MARYDHWSHGTAGAVQYPNRCTLIEPQGLVLRIEQRSQFGVPTSRDNFLILPVPTPTIIDGDTVRLRYARFQADVSGGAQVVGVQVHDGHGTHIVFGDSSSERAQLDAGNQSGSFDLRITGGLPEEGVVFRGGLAIALALMFPRINETGVFMLRGGGIRFEV